MTSLHIQTPLLKSLRLSEKAAGAVWLKMEALQPTGSFKLRGIGYACRELVRRGTRTLVSSSGGNAGLAVAYAGRHLGVPVKVVVPETTTERAKELIRLEEAEVLVYGTSWSEAHQYAIGLSERGSTYLHPFDDALIWKGHSTLIDEIVESGLKPDVVVTSVGGGGLLSGIVEGLHRNGWKDIPVVAVETKGADSFHRAVSAGQLVELETIDSVAMSLGAKTVCQQALDWTRKHEIYSVLVSDREAVTSCLRFLDDHRILVEPACGASLAVVYDAIAEVRSRGNVLVVVCGGVTTTYQQLVDWLEQAT
jgi:L-serine/L-threonine ammonia-lyase